MEELSPEQLGELTKDQLEKHLADVRARIREILDAPVDDPDFAFMAQSLGMHLKDDEGTPSPLSALRSYERRVSAALAQNSMPQLPGVLDGPSPAPVRPTEQVAGGNEMPVGQPDPPKGPAPSNGPDYGGPDDIDAMLATDRAGTARDRLDVDDDETDAPPDQPAPPSDEPAPPPSPVGAAPTAAGPPGSTFGSVDPSTIKLGASGNEPMQVTLDEDTTYTPSTYTPELTTPDGGAAPDAAEERGGGPPWPVIGAAVAAVVVAAGAVFAIVHAATGSSPTHPLATPPGVAVTSPAGAAPASNLQVQGGFNLGSDGSVGIAVVMNQGTHAVTIDFTGPGVPAHETFQVPASPGITPNIAPPPPNWPCTPASFTAQVVAIDGAPLSPTEQSQPNNRWTASEGSTC